MEFGAEFESLNTSEQFLKLFYDDYLFEAFDLYESHKSELSALSECSVLLEDIQYARQSLATLSEIDNWKKVRDEQGIATYCHGSGDNFMIGIETMIAQPVFPILALCAEVDLLPNLCATHSVHRLSTAEVIGMPTRFRRVMRYVYDVPWPVNSREAILQCVGFPIAETHSALLTVRSSTQSSFLGVPIPPEDPKLVRCSMSLGCANLMCLEPELTQMTIFGHADLKFVHLTQRFIPTAVVNFFGKHVAYYFMQTFKKQLAGFAGSLYEQRVRDKPDFYQELQRRVNIYSGF